VPFRYREYREEPLGADELREVLALLGVGPRDVLRPKEAEALGIGTDVDGDALVARMVEAPTLLQRPIAVRGDRAIVARPETLLRGFLGLD
jgi:arsenate reductase